MFNIINNTMQKIESSRKIRAARERFNIAIANKNVDMIRTLLAPSYHIVTGRSAQNHDAHEEAIRWSETFRDDATVIYRRTPRKITINQNWGLAQEIGKWQGSYTIGGSPIRASGIYAAKWQRAENSEWLLQVEVFTTLHCTGSPTGCLKPDPISVSP